MSTRSYAELNSESRRANLGLVTSSDGFGGMEPVLMKSRQGSNPDLTTPSTGVPAKIDQALASPLTEQPVQVSASQVGVNQQGAFACLGEQRREICRDERLPRPGRRSSDCDDAGIGVEKEELQAGAQRAQALDRDIVGLSG